LFLFRECKQTRVNVTDITFDTEFEKEKAASLGGCKIARIKDLTEKRERKK